MDGEKLFEYVKRQAEKVTRVASLSNMGWGYAIPIPDEADEEAKRYVNSELAKLYWTFHLDRIQHKWYFILFPL